MTVGSQKGTFMCVGKFRRVGESRWRYLYGYVRDLDNGGYQIDFDAAPLLAGDDFYLIGPGEILSRRANDTRT
jgi:hypothetical protein